MTSTATHFTKTFPKRADITGLPEQAFHMLDDRDKYYKYLIGGTIAGTIAAIGTIAPGGTFQYLYAPQVHHDLGGTPVGFVGNSSNKMGEFSCVYINLSDFKFFPFVEATSSMNALLKHTDVTPFASEHLTYTGDLKDLTDSVRGTFLPNFFIVYFGQDIPQGNISSDDEKTAMAKMGPGYALWVTTVSEAIENMEDINSVMDAFGTVDDLSQDDFYKKHFYAHYDKAISLSVAGAPFGRITTVQSDDYPKEVSDIKKIFFAQQVLPQQVQVPTSSALTLQLPGDLEKEVVAKDGINKLKLFHICGTINPESTTFGTLSYPAFSTGMELVLGQPRASRAGALSDLCRQALKDARDSDMFSIRSTSVSLKHISKAMTTHILTGNFATDEAASLDNEAHAIDPSAFLPQRNTALVNREAGKDLHARSENAMDVLDSHKSKTATSIARIGTIQNVDDFTCLCVNSDTIMMGMFSTEGLQPLYRQFLLMFIKTVNNRDWTDWFAKNGGNMPGLHLHLYIFLERIFNLLADFSKNFTNINIVTMGRPISELDTSSLTKALTVMKAFITQVELAQSTNSPIVVCRSSFYKYEVNPVNNMKVCPPAYDYEGAARANAQVPRRAEAPKRDSIVPPSDGENGRALVVNQRLKKPRRSVADAPKRNVSDMGMFFLFNSDIKASDVFPKGMAELVCVDFTCKGRECTRENCSHLHPRKVSDMKKESVIAIGVHFLEKRIGWFNEWHFLKFMDKLPDNFTQLMGGKDGHRSKKD
jgi:hypothetical protein